MKRLKNFFSWRVFSLALLSGIVVATSCTKDFDKVNTNPATIAKPGPAELPFLFSKAQSSATQNMWNYQISQNLFADQYAQYFGCRATYFASDRLFIVMNWVVAAFDPMYTDVLPQLQTIMLSYDPQSAGADGLPDYTKFTTAESAIASVMWVHAFHQVTDYWGPIPYFKAGLSTLSVPYDAQDKIYDDFFKRLASASAILTSKAGTNAFGNFDIIYGGDVNKWLKFTNTLRLRLALRISSVDPARAQTEAEAAVASGVMTTSPGDDALITRNYSKGGDGNGLSIMSPWDEFRMSASMESVLKGYSDPRMPIYFQPALATGTYEGLRNGLSVGDLGLNDQAPDALSHVGPRWSDFLAVPNTGTGNVLMKTNNTGGGGQGLSTPSNVMHAAEAYFLRAEGALNGWNMGGTAGNLYNSGITASFNQWGITDAPTIAAYLASAAVPIAPNDHLNSPPMNNIPIAFSGVAATQRAQIAQQKWIALFPNGIEAWADYRRQHNVLKLYPVANSQNPDIPDPTSTTNYLRRIPFLSQELLRNKDGVASGVTVLEGPDKVTTPLWWDKNP